MRDGVGEAAGAAYDRHGAVAHGDQLAEAARLVARGHEEEIAAAVEKLAEPVIELDARGYAIGVTGGYFRYGLLVLVVTLAEDDELEVLPVE